ncbi:TATA-binding protein-associated factor BTAF1-like isoform X1 [Vigna unguiculata]|uniref:TATA-binding protein-associated factor BTAF1-like isoform X1 n=1 Tax=Vigna unguiculata TaxID=3917 RepID=UPI0010169440|nr:TATA-binding protein-associated factor BTAF1-like isoform X1 [Vigna unguiculata]
MRSEAGQLLDVVKSSGMFDELLTATQIELDRLSVNDAIGFASKIPALCNDSSANESLAKNIMDDIESSKQRLLTTSGYLKCVQVTRCEVLFETNRTKSVKNSIFLHPIYLTVHVIFLGL